MGKLNIKTRITLWYTLFTLVVVSLLLGLTYFSFKRISFQQLEQSLVADGNQAALEIEIKWGAVKFQTDYTARQTSMVVYTEDNQVLSGKPPRNLPLPQTMSTHEEPYIVVDDAHNSWLVYDTSLVSLRYTGWVRALKPLEPLETSNLQLLSIMVVAVPFFVVLIALGGYWISKRSFAPIQKIAVTADNIHENNLSDRIQLDSDDELGRLAQTIDKMLDRLEGHIQREKQFISDASHELRTPLAILMAYAEDGLHQGQLDSASLEIILEQSQQMNAVISHLLLLTRMENDASYLSWESVDVENLLIGVVDTYQWSLEEKDLSVTLSTTPLTAHGVQTSLVAICSNLMDNAIKFTPPLGEIGVSLWADTASYTLCVENSGEVLDAQERKAIFQRFYRSKKHLRVAGTGLGLPIASLLVQQLGGKIWAESHVGKGMAFYVQLPLRTDSSIKGKD